MAAELIFPIQTSFLANVNHDAGSPYRPFDAPYAGRRQMHSRTGGAAAGDVLGPSEGCATPDETRVYLDRLATELERREWLVLLRAEGDDAVLYVTHPLVHCLTDCVTCHQTPDEEWQIWWAGRHPIAPADDVTAAADRIVQTLRVVGAEENKL